MKMSEVKILAAFAASNACAVAQAEKNGKRQTLKRWVLIHKEKPNTFTLEEARAILNEPERAKEDRRKAFDRAEQIARNWQPIGAPLGKVKTYSDDKHPINKSGHALPDLPTQRTKNRRNVIKGLANRNPLGAMIRDYAKPSTTENDPETYRVWLIRKGQAMAKRYVAKALEQGKDLVWLQRDLAETATSSLGEYVANLAKYNETLQTEALNRLVLGILPNAIVHALRAMDSLRRHMSRNVATETAYFDAIDTRDILPNSRVIGESDWIAPEHVNADLREHTQEEIITYRQGESENALNLIKARCDQLSRRVQDRLTLATSNREKGHLRSCQRLIDRARQWATASINSQTFAFRVPLSFHVQHETIVQTLRTSEGRYAGQRSHVLSTGKTVSNSALWQRARKIGQTLGIKLM